MRHSINLLVLILTGALVSFSALGQSEDNELRTTKHVLGPVTIGYGQHLKVCMTDVAGLTGAADRNSRRDDSSLVHTQIMLFDSQDTTKPLADVDGNDFLIWQRGYGMCVNVAVGDVNGDGLSIGGEPRSIIGILVSITEGTTVFQPMATGQLIAPNSTSGVALLLPAIQAAVEGPEPTPPPPPPQN